MCVQEQHGARVLRGREKGFEDPCENLDSILDASGGIGMVVHNVQTAHLSWDGVGPLRHGLCDVTGL